MVTWHLTSVCDVYLLCFELYLSSAKKQNKLTTSPHLAAQAFLHVLILAAELLDYTGSTRFLAHRCFSYFEHRCITIKGSDPSNRFKTSGLHPTLVQRESHTSFNERQLILYSNIVHGVMRGAALLLHGPP
jgi:hypothetical protein